MTSKLIPSDPSKVMVIRELSPAITTLSTPFWRFGHLKVGGRGTIGKHTLNPRLFKHTILTNNLNSPPAERLFGCLLASCLDS